MIIMSIYNLLASTEHSFPFAISLLKHWSVRGRVLVRVRVRVVVVGGLVVVLLLGVVVVLLLGVVVVLLLAVVVVLLLALVVVLAIAATQPTVRQAAIRVNFMFFLGSKTKRERRTCENFPPVREMKWDEI